MRAILRLVKKTLERFFKLRIFHARSLPRGVDFFCDMRADFPHLNFFSVFDVGANIGECAVVYAARFPEATIFCLEPVAATFQQLRAKTKHCPRIKTYQVALGSATTKLPIMTHAESHLNSLVSSELMEGAFAQEMVEVVTLDEFIAKEKIEHIDFLKIDAEGFDLEVLKGAQQALENCRIDFIQVEIGFGATKIHNQLDKFSNFLIPKGYVLYGIYEQSPDWKARAPWLMYANAIFVHREFCNKFRGN